MIAGEGLRDPPVDPAVARACLSRVGRPGEPRRRGIGRRSPRTLVRAVGWALGIGIARATPVPIGLRPSITVDPDVERVLVYPVSGGIAALG